MKKLLLLVFPAIIILSCGQQKNNEPVNSGNADDSTYSEKNISFIPVTAILLNQVAALDSMPVTILQVKTINKKEDSAWLPAAKVRPLIAPFLSPAIDKNNLTSLFKESRFDDQSTAAVTFTYTPKEILPDSFPLRRWDVYFDPAINAIRRIYIVKAIKENGMPVTQQLTWQMDKWAKIVTISQENANTSAVVTETKWVWDLDEE